MDTVRHGHVRHHRLQDQDSRYRVRALSITAISNFQSQSGILGVRFVPYQIVHQYSLIDAECDLQKC